MEDQNHSVHLTEPANGPESLSGTSGPGILEDMARDVYNRWMHMPGWVPWVEGGNSHKQDDARRIARASLGLTERDQADRGCVVTNKERQSEDKSTESDSGCLASREPPK